MRRSHILLLSDEGLTPQQIAQRLHCGDQTVRNVIRAFDQEGLGCLEEKSSRPHHDNSTFTGEGLQRLANLVHRSPRDFGGKSSLWSLAELANVCFKQGIVARPISYESVRRALVKLGLDWRHARHPISSHDPQYERKKAASTLDGLGQKGPVISPLTQPTLSPGVIQLMELEGRFAQAVAEGGGKAFAQWFADDAVVLNNGQPATAGRAAIAAQAQWDPKVYQLTWVAQGGQMGPSNDMGFTWGH